MKYQVISFLSQSKEFILDIFPQFQDKKCYLVSHSDLDGIGARIVFEYYFMSIFKEVKIFNTSKYDMADFNQSELKDFDFLFFTDLTPPTREFYQSCLDTNPNLQIYIWDHHIGSKQTLGELPNYFYDNTKCGTQIFFDWICVELQQANARISRCIYQFIELVNTYDLFLTESALWSSAKGLSSILYGMVDWKAKLDDTHKYNKFIDLQLKKFNLAKSFFFTDMELSIKQKAEIKEKTLFTKAIKEIKIRKDSLGRNYGYVELDSKLSIVIHLLLRHFGENLIYIIGHSTWKEKALGERNGELSLRCGKNFDVSEIAKLHNGSGHKCASGCKLSLEDFEKLKKGEIHLV